jgi:hypothetical protein
MQEVGPMAKRIVVSLAAAGLAIGVAATAVVAARSGSDDRKLALLPLGAPASAVGAAASADATAAGASKIAAPGRMGIYGGVTYTVSGTLPKLDGTAAVWKIDKTTTLDAAAVDKLAKSLGVSGTPTDSSQGNGYPMWTVGANDGGMHPTLFIDGGSGLRWNFNDPSASMGEVACAAVATTVPALATGVPYPAADGSTATVSPPAIPAPPDSLCPTPAPPANVPSAAEAESKAKALAASIGLSDTNLVWESHADQWNAYALAYRTFDGVKFSEPWFNAGYGAEGKLTYASGLLGDPVKVADYPRIGTDSAFVKLKDGTGMYYGFGRLGGVGLASGVDQISSASGSAPASDSVASPATEVAPATIAPTPTCPSRPVPIPAAAPASDAKPLVDASPCPAPDVCFTEEPLATDAAGSVVPQPTVACVPAANLGGPPDQTAPTIPAPEPVVVTISGVTETLLGIQGTDGAFYLVPGYTFTTKQSDQGAGTVDQQFPVLAIDDKLIAPVSQVIAPDVATAATTVPESFPTRSASTIGGATKAVPLGSGSAPAGG